MTDNTYQGDVPHAPAELQTLLKKIVDVAPVALHQFRMEANGNTNMPYASPDIEEIYGLTPEEMVADFSRANRLIHPDDRKGVREAMEESARTLQPFHHEWRIQHPRKGEIWVECVSSPERMQDGSTVWYGYFHDITQRRQAEKDLKLWEFALSRLPEGVFLIDKQARILFVNDEACRSLGYTRKELLTLGIRDIDPDFPMDKKSWDENWLNVKERGSLTFETTHKRKNGELFPVEITANFFEYDGYEYHLSLARDITQRRKIERELKLWSFALDNIQEAVYLVDRYAKFLYVNNAACRALGYTRNELTQMGVADIDPEFPLENWDSHWEQVRETGTRLIESSHRHREGYIFPVEVSINYFKYSEQEYQLALVRDVSQRKEQEKRIEYLAYHDPLTGLPNRTLTMDHLEQAIAQAHRHNQMLGVLFIDLDRFKNINDTLGHPAGDALLVEVGKRLLDSLREEDTVGRVGGDEFLVLLMELSSAETAAHVTEKLLETLAKPFSIEGQDLHVSASIGISMYPRDASQPTALVQYADTALYIAKDEGRATFRFYSSEVDSRIHDRLVMENALRRAIEQNELMLHYQPQMDLASGRITGLEALVRWKHPQKGLISPAEFIPIAEEIGLIHSLGDWVLHEASSRAQAWHTAGIPGIRMCVNVSRRQLIQPDFVNRVQSTLETTGCDPRLLELEITESSVMTHPEEAIAKLQTLHEMGIQLALDDFGTGYSSLAYLKRFPLDRLKIDRSFVAGIPEDTDDMAIVQTTIVLARQLNLAVVAEGVENEAQQAFLRKNGCHEVQGFLLGRPLPIQELEKQFDLSGKK